MGLFWRGARFSNCVDLNVLHPKKLFIVIIITIIIIIIIIKGKNMSLKG